MWVTDKSLLYDQITNFKSLHKIQLGGFSLLWYKKYADCNFISICKRKKTWKVQQYLNSRNFRPYFNDYTNSNYEFRRVLNCEVSVCLIHKVKSGISISAMWKSLASNKYLLSFQYFNGFLGVPSRIICSQEDETKCKWEYLVRCLLQGN